MTVRLLSSPLNACPYASATYATVLRNTDHAM